MNAAGQLVENAFWIDNRPDDARETLTNCFMRLPATQALVQTLGGRGPTPVTGVHHVLQRHGLVGNAIADVRVLLELLNEVGIVAYSRKHQTVRITAPIPEPDAANPTIRVVEPTRPFSNIKHLREILRAAREYIWWCDPQFSKKGLEPLADEADAAHITEIRILSGPANATADAASDFKRFKAEMATAGITAEWRIVPRDKMTWHDRFIVSKNEAWNVPPINTLYKGDYSEAGKSEARPPFDTWWQEGNPIV